MSQCFLSPEELGRLSELNDLIAGLEVQFYHRTIKPSDQFHMVVRTTRPLSKAEERALRKEIIAALKGRLQFSPMARTM